MRNKDKNPTPSQIRNKMLRIQKKMNDCDSMLKSLPDYVQENIRQYHGEGYTLQHCLRWGYQAAENLAEDAKLISKEDD